ncbi:AMP-binding protein [Streptomyces zhihengii]
MPPSGTDDLLDGGPSPDPAPPVLDLMDHQVRTRPGATALVHGDTSLTYAALAAAVRERAAALAAEGAAPDGSSPCTGRAASTRSSGCSPSSPPAPPTCRSTSAPRRPQRGDPAGRLRRHGPRARRGRPPRRGGPRRARRGRGRRLRHLHLRLHRHPQRCRRRPRLPGPLHRRGHPAYGIGPDDRVLQFSPLHFDASIQEIFATLGAGGTLVLRTDDMLDVGELLDGCARHGVTLLDLPAAYWHELVYVLATGSARLPEALRTVIIYGEAALPERIAQWRALAGERVRLLNAYGPTETTVVATVADLTRHEPGPVPIGRPLPGVRAAVVAGELWLLGAASPAATSTAPS